ncbi:MAG TPA: DUF4336 domain-containing protein [Opitutaceae bacterium]|nr:DUF4336 domain-containing protein [Opitutaceae bacterium]
MAPLLKAFAPGVWEYNAPLRVLGIELGHRMTVVRLADGTLWIHSPVMWSRELDGEIRMLGEVRHFVAPNRMHDGFWPEWFDHFKGAQFSAAPGVVKEHPELPFSMKLADDRTGVPGGELQARLMRGMPLVNEVVFHHVPSRTLIVADLMFNLDPPDLRSRLLLRLNGALGRPTPSRMFRMAIRDRAAFRESLEGVLLWDFDRVIVGHGENLVSGGRNVLREAFAFLK